VYDPALVGHGTSLEILQAMVTAVLGIIFLSAGFEGYCFFLRTISLPIRIIFMASGLLTFHPSNITDLIGLGLVAAAVAVHYFIKTITAKRVHSILPER